MRSSKGPKSVLDRTHVISESSEFPSSLYIISEGLQTVRELVPHEFF